eukprot:TRINITY_DN11606_c0_g1_i3.p1 TRINITY_DN11606_c0_g1~~TRINITY_DN11606_c0_g1_i3.p1  ORF type:complete len:611 (+),score=181.34 TRINITY_DN11606_c0_g1_i3:182-2014(+)
MASWASWAASAQKFVDKAADKAKEAAAAAQSGDLLEKAKEAAKKAADEAQKLSETVQAEYRRTFEGLDCQIFKIRPDLILMEYPSQETIERLAKRLNNDYAQRMLIFNMSEKSYDTTRFTGEVVDVNFRGLPAPPIELFMELCLSGSQWLAADSNNVLIVHCFSGYTRSVAFLSCFMAFRGLCSNPSEALKEVCDHMPFDSVANVLPSQHRYMTYFQQCQQGLTPVNKRLRLSKAMLNAVPCFEKEGNVAFRPFLEVWCQGELVFTTFSSGSSSAGQSSGQDVWPASYSKTDPCVVFQLPSDLFVAGDVLVRVRHVYQDGTKDTALRLAFHTGFAPAGLQLSKKQLDGACDDSRFNDEFCVDLMFEEAPKGDDDAADDKEGSEASAAIFAKAREVSAKLREEEEQRRKREEAAAPAAASRGGDDDDVEALEATLMRAGGASSSSAPAAGSKAKISSASTADAEELRKALAAASADDVKAATASSKAATSGSSAAAETEKGGQDSEEKASFAPPPRDATAKASAGNAPKGSGAASADTKSKTAGLDDIDSLFSEFDAAMSSTSKGGSSASEAKKETTAAASTEKKAASKDVFADVDDFLAELDSGLTGSKK